MASSYPSGLDTFSTAHVDNVNEVIRAAFINDLDDAVNKIEAELGTLPKGAYGSVKLRFNNIEYPTLNAQTGTSYTLVLADAGDIISMNNSAANNVNLPTNASVAFPYPGDGSTNGCTQITFRQAGAGSTAIVPAAGVTLLARGLTTGTMHLAGQYAYATATKVAINTWELAGDIIQ